MENKKTKLTISGKPKKSFKNFDSSKAKGNKTVVIEKKTKNSGKSFFNKNSDPKKSPSNFKHGLGLNPSFGLKNIHLFLVILKRESLQSKELLKD